ncbi:MAG: cyclodeaminase/cyclohydrolase family protein [Armatimonadetes bacterium]|nr:cyclodeaminase/cyclohydrolase family protein [Armatimonadota bacterium]
MEESSSITIREFIDSLSSEMSTPSGGSACGVVGALAGALVMMSAAFTLGREKFASVQEEVAEIRERAQRLRDMSLELATADEEAFGRVMEARKLPRDTPEQEHLRRSSLDATLREATDIPLQIAEAAGGISLLARRVAEIGNPSLRADALTGAYLADSVTKSCAEQVKENLRWIKDEDYRRAAESRLRRLTRPIHEHQQASADKQSEATADELR